MSTTGRPTTRWPSSSKSTTSIIQPAPFIIPQKKVYRPLMNQQHTFTHRMTKTKHDIEQLFKLYYSTNIKFDTFQKQVVTGTRIPSAQTSSSFIPNHFLNNSSNVFQSKHCVSREDDEHPSYITEHQIINNESKPIPIKRTVQIRINNTPTSPSPEGISLSSNCDLNVSENLPLSTQDNEYNEPIFLNNVTLIDDLSTDYHEQNHLKRSKSTLGQHSITSITTLPSVPLATLSSMNNRKDLINLSHSSFSTGQSLQPHIITGTAVNVRKRSPTKSALLKQRAKSCIQQTNFKTSAVTVQYDQSEFPMCLGARVVSIPSKCNRYVLLTFPQASNRYSTPTTVERLLLPERFPILFQNIIQNQNNK